jgi:hypothetical protein
MQAYTWISHWLPFRASDTIYSCFDYDKLPPVDSSTFERYRTVADVLNDPPTLGPNPMFADWCFDVPSMFLCDKNQGVSWCVDKYGRVVIPWSSIIPRIVAPSLAVFLARMALENSIWWSICYNNLDEKTVRDRTADPDDIWSMLEPILTDKQLAYLRPYCDEARIWYKQTFNK